MKNKSSFHSGLVWIASGTALIIYASIGLIGVAIPGVEELVDFVQGAQGWYIYPAVFLAIFIEGLYVVGSVFPGTSIVLLTAIIAQSGGWTTFFGVLLTILVGWNIAGIANVMLARICKLSGETGQTNNHQDEYPEITWFPAFRANTEVAEVVEGKSVTQVLLSSLRVKTLTTAALAIYAFFIPYLIDIDKLENDEGFIGLSLIALISIGVGVSKVLDQRSNQVETPAE
jgi:hypothetical protein